jgi:oligosaccharide repeat unit polymerase
MVQIDCTIIAIFCVLAALMIRKNTVFSPWSVTLIVWIVEITLFITQEHGLYPTTGNFEMAVFLWVMSFCLSSYIAFCRTRKGSTIQPHACNKKVYNVMFILAVICVPLSLYYTYKFVTANALSDNIFFNLRYYATDSHDAPSFLKYTTYIALIPLLAECNSPQINKLRLLLLFCLNIMLGLATMAKTALFTTIISTVFVLSYNGKISKAVFGYVFIGFIALTILFNNIRSFSGDAGGDDADVISVYLLSPIPAFDTAVNLHHVSYDGSSTFRFFYQFAKSCGFDVEAKRTVQEFVRVPMMTNVYTIFYQYYLDFGYIGILIFGLVNGWIYGRVYAKINECPHLKLFYAYLFVSLCLQFFNEVFWVVFSIVIQVFILSKIIYSGTRKVRKYG